MFSFVCKVATLTVASRVYVNAAPSRTLRQEPKALDECFNQYKNPIDTLELDRSPEHRYRFYRWGYSAAYLFDGVTGRSSEMNDESKWVLGQYNLADPKYIGDLPDNKICLVDVDQISQLPVDLDTNRIVGIVDHHALQSSTVVIDEPIRIDIRPVGIVSTIVARYYGSANKPMSEDVAGILMSAIISDTLNLNSPTTTELDKMMLSCLARQSNTKDVNTYADAMFKAKANGFNNLDDDEVVRADTKVFDLYGHSSMMARKQALSDSMKKLKSEDTQIQAAICGDDV